jgi:uncharacterized protein YjeT (DUF2065 family)
METATVLTLRLAEAIGLYALAAGVSMVIAPHRWRVMVDDLDRIPGLTYAFGLIAFAFGIFILFAHRLWSDPLAIAVSLAGWIATIEGLLLIAWPDPLVAFARRMIGNSRVWALIPILLGAFLFIAGLTGRAVPIPQGV